MPPGMIAGSWTISRSAMTWLGSASAHRRSNAGPVRVACRVEDSGHSLAHTGNSTTLDDGLSLRLIAPREGLALAPTPHRSRTGHRRPRTWPPLIEPAPYEGAYDLDGATARIWSRPEGRVALVHPGPSTFEWRTWREHLAEKTAGLNSVGAASVTTWPQRRSGVDGPCLGTGLHEDPCLQS